MLNKLSKTDLIDIVLKMQDNSNATSSQRASLVVEIKVLKSNFKNLETGMAVVRNVNNKLVEQIDDT